MIDIHTHIIPNLDDGPDNLGDSVAMGRIAAQDGITAMISTSHSKEASTIGYEAMQERLRVVQAAWNEAGLDIRLELGVEIFLRPDTIGDLRSGKVWTLAGSRYTLVELPYRPWPPYAEQALFDLQVAGYTPILAHPERYSAIQDDPNRLYTLVERGVLAQVTASAFVGEQGPHVQRCAETLARHRLVQFISSDAHGGNKRRPIMSQGLRAAQELAGEAEARAMAQDNPARILSDTPITPNPERVASHGWLLGGLFRGD